MPSEETPVSNNRKRLPLAGAEAIIVSSPPPSAKRRKHENPLQHQTPSSFWDNLSRQYLTSRTLREFDRRTVCPAAPISTRRPGEDYICLSQLKRFARHGGPSLGDLRAYPQPEKAIPSNQNMSLSQSGPRKRAKSEKETDTSSRTKKSSAYDPAFEQHLIDHGVYPDGYGGVRNEQRPHNWDEIHTRLAMPRASLSLSRFTHEDFLDFKEKNQDALTEATVMSKVFPVIAGHTDIPHSENLLFGNFEDLTDGSITKAQPDFYDGSRPANLDRRIRDELGRYFMPSTNTAAPCLPNFFAEGKGPNGNIAVCKNQILYDGALGARGMHKLRSYADPEAAFDNNAYTVTSTYHPSGFLTLYVTHPVPSESPTFSMEYRTTKLNGWDITGAQDSFRQGASALRNARDWAKVQREGLIAAANRKALNLEHLGVNPSTQSFKSLSPKTHVQLESEVSADELNLDTGKRARSTCGIPARVRSNAPAFTSRRRSKKPTRVARGPSTGNGGQQKI